MPATTQTDAALAVLDREIARLTRIAAARDQDVKTQTAHVRRDLDAVDAAIDGTLRIPASVSGESFVASSARDLARSIDDRNSAYETLTRTTSIREAVAARVGVEA